MNGVFHFDLAGVSALARKTADEAIAAARAGAVTKNDHLGVDAQERLIGIMELVIVGQADLSNRGVPAPCIMQALGSLLGSAAVSASKSTGNPLMALDDIHVAFMSAVRGLMANVAPKGAIQKTARFSSTPGGRA